MSTVWTIKVSKKLDSLVENIVKLLGYTSKAEFIREAVREALLRKNIGLLGLHSMDKLCTSRGDPKKALEELSSLAVPKEVFPDVNFIVNQLDIPPFSMFSVQLL